MLSGKTILTLDILKGWLPCQISCFVSTFLCRHLSGGPTLLFVKKALGSSFCHGLVVQNLPFFPG